MSLTMQDTFTAAQIRELRRLYQRQRTLETEVMICTVDCPACAPARRSLKRIAEEITELEKLLQER